MAPSCKKKLVRIVSGGQTGADRAALDFAMLHDIPYGGWCPKGGWAEDLSSPPGLLSSYPAMKETPETRPEQRTEWNVRDSSLTLILVQSPELEKSKGTVLTKSIAAKLNRPCLVANMAAEDEVNTVRRWLDENIGEGILNIAGPRESESPGLYEQAKQFLGEVFST